MRLRRKKIQQAVLSASTFAFFGLSLGGMLTGCAEDEIRRDAPDASTIAPAPAAQTDPVPAVESSVLTKPPGTVALEARLAEMQDRLQGMERKVTDLQAQLELAQNGAPATAKGVEGLKPHPATNAGRADPEAGFTQDDVIQSYRKAMILFQAQKYPEAILAFSAFVEQNPDHVLAGSAQFYLGRSYYEQKEYKLALKEWERVITSYDRSARVADTLGQMAEAEDHLKRPKEAATHRQLLTQLFPQSPAARLAQRSQALRESAIPETTGTLPSAVGANKMTAPESITAPASFPATESETSTASPPTDHSIQPPETAPALE